jgi:hypothetical protein
VEVLVEIAAFFLGLWVDRENEKIINNKEKIQKGMMK